MKSESLKVLHYSMHPGCILDIKNLVSDMNAEIESNIELKTIFPENRLHQDYLITEIVAQQIWEKNKSDFISSDVIMFSDTTPMAWSVMKNKDKLSKDQKIFLWIVNRFDYAVENNPHYLRILQDFIKDERVYLFFMHPFDRFYLSRYIDISVNTRQYEMMSYGKRNKEDYPCLPSVMDQTNKIFVMAYENETKFSNITERMNELNVPFFQRKERLPDQRYSGPFEIRPYSAVFHIPYAWGTIALSEYLHQGKTFILPSLSWLDQQYNSGKLWMQTSRSTHLMSKYSMFYSPEFSDSFVYFDKEEDLVNITNDLSDLIDRGIECKNKITQKQNDIRSTLRKICNLKMKDNIQ